MSRTITCPTEYVNPMAALRESILRNPASPPDLIAMADALAGEWNAMCEVVYAAGEWCESRSDKDRRELVDAFATWKNWVERAIPMGAWVVAGVEPEPEPPAWEPSTKPAPDDSEVPW